MHDAAKTADRISEAVDNVNDFRKSIDNTTEVITPKVHGNSLNCPKTNYGYALLDSDNNIMKFGETINPTKRYSQKFLSENGLTMQILESGSKTDIHYWQYDMNMYFKDKYGMFPPMNKRGW